MKKYRAFMQFSLAELKAELKIKEAGISIGVAASDIDQYSSTAVEQFNVGLNDIPLPSEDGMIIPEGLKPTQADFLYVPFRLLSATMVAAGSWRATMFPAKVLKKATDMLLGKGVYTDHDDRPKNWTGYVAKTKWQNQQIINGQTIPGGINGLLGIDTTLERNRDIAKGIVTGAVYSNSVGIMFDYKMSHQFEDEWEFRRRVGTIAEDGRMIHLEVTNIIEIYETSLVSLGADPFAKRIGENGLVNIDNGGTYTENQTNSFKLQFSKEYETNKYNISCGLNKNVLILTGKKITLENEGANQNNEIEMNKEKLNLLLAKFGVASEEELTEDVIQKFGTEPTLAKVKSEALAIVQKDNDAIEDVNLDKFLEKHTFVAKAELETLQQSVSKVTELESQVETLEADKATLTKAAELGEGHLKEQRELAKKLYRLSKMDKADETVCALFDKATAEELSSLIKEHGIVVGEKFAYSCKKCGCTDVKFGSALETDKVEVEEKPITFTTPETIREREKTKNL